MNIHCANCKKELKANDLIIKDDLYSLIHLACYTFHNEYIYEIDSYKNIIEKYHFFQSEIH